VKIKVGYGVKAELGIKTFINKWPLNISEFIADRMSRAGGYMCRLEIDFRAVPLAHKFYSNWKIPRPSHLRRNVLGNKKKLILAKAGIFIYIFQLDPEKVSRLRCFCAETFQGK